MTKEQIKETNLLPKIKDRCLLAPEISSIFSKKDENFIEILGIFTRVLDGHDYQSDSGAHGNRGYQGEYTFTMVGAVVDVPYRVHKHLATLIPSYIFCECLFYAKQKTTTKSWNKIILLLEENRSKKS